MNSPVTIIPMPLTYSITVGVGAGFVVHTLIKVVKGKLGEVHLLMWVVSGSFVIYFAQELLRTWFS